VSVNAAGDVTGTMSQTGARPTATTSGDKPDAQVQAVGQKALDGAIGRSRRQGTTPTRARRW